MVLCFATIWAWFFVTLGVADGAPPSVEPGQGRFIARTAKTLSTKDLPADPRQADVFARTDAETETFEEEDEPAAEHSESPAFAGLRFAGTVQSPISPAASIRTLRLPYPPEMTHIPMRC